MATEKLTTVVRPDPTVITLEELYAKIRIEDKKVHIPSLGKSVTIRPFSIEERRELARRATVGKEIDSARFTVLTLVRGLVDPRIPEKDLEVLLKQSNGKFLEDIAKEIWAASGLSSEAAQKNESRTTSSEGTGSSSPETSEGSPLR